MATSTSTPPELLRALGPIQATAVVVGSVIGSAIFLVPSSIAAELASPGLILLVWLGSGVLSLFGALSYAELGAMMPRAGGQYVFLKAAYGELWAFLFGWTEFLVIRSGATAAVATAFGLYAGYFLPLDFKLLSFGDGSTTFAIDGVKLAAVACIALLVVVNSYGVRFGGWVQTFFAFLKVGVVLGIIVLGFGLGKGSAPHFAPLWPSKGFFDALSAMGIAMVATLWAYDGWSKFTFVAGEVKDPQRNVPLALIIGVFMVIVLYLLANIAYFDVLSLGGVMQSKLVAADAMKALIGPIGGAVISAAVLCSTFGSANGSILTGPRVYYAMARDGLFFKRVQEVHPKYRTPVVSILLQGTWAALLGLSGTYSQLFTYVIFAAWFFYAMTVGGVLILRKKMPDAPRPYRVWGYPVIPVLFILAALAIVVSTLLKSPVESLVGLVIVVTGLPAYRYWRSTVTVRMPMRTGRRTA